MAGSTPASAIAEPGAAKPAASTSLTSSPSKPSPPLAAPPPAQDVEPGYHGYNSNADLEE